MGAGLLAKNAVARGLRAKPWVKTSLAPGSRVVMDYLERAQLVEPLEQLGFFLVGFGCTTCIGNSGPLLDGVSELVHSDDLSVVSVLSGNRNFEGRIHPDVRMNYLASPPLVVAYALAGTMDIDLTTDPLGEDGDGKPVFLADIWPSEQEVSEAIRASLTSEMFRTRYGAVFEGDEYWGEVPVAEGETFSWQDDSTYVKNPPFFEGMTMTPTPVSDIEGARVLAMVGDSVTTDHISPAGSIGPDTPAGRYLAEHGVPRNDFNSYGARRGNHEVMMRGTFANVRLRNRLAPGTEGGYTLHLPDGTETSIYEAAMQYADEGVPLIVLAGREYGTGSSRDWAAKGTALLGGARRHRPELRAHPPLQSGRHGRHPAPVLQGRLRREPGPTRDGDVHHRRDRRPQRGRAAQGADGDRHGGRRVDHRVQGDRPHRHPDGGRVLPSRRDPPLRPAPVGRLSSSFGLPPSVHEAEGRRRQGMRVTRNSSAVAPSGSPARAPEARPPSVTRRAHAVGVVDLALVAEQRGNLALDGRCRLDRHVGTGSTA